MDHKPQFLNVGDILKYSTEHTMSLLGLELKIRLDELENDWHYSSLEKIFFENKVMPEAGMTSSRKCSAPCSDIRACSSAR